MADNVTGIGAQASAAVGDAAAAAKTAAGDVKATITAAEADAQARIAHAEGKAMGAIATAEKYAAAHHGVLIAGAVLLLVGVVIGALIAQTFAPAFH